MSDLISSAMEVYKAKNLPAPEIYEFGLRDGLRLAITFLQRCAGVESELDEEPSKRSQYEREEDSFE